MFKIAVFVSGRGSNLKAILNSFSEKAVSVRAVVSNRSDCPAINLAQGKNIPCYFVSQKAAEGFISYSELQKVFLESEIDLIVLAGFLKKIPDNFVEYFKNKIINIHPALLPSFGGKGMYGMNVHEAVFYASAKVSGATVHFVNTRYDEGKIIAQQCIDISDVQSPEEIASRVLMIEHRLLPFVIKKFSLNKIVVKNNRVLIDD